MSRSSFGTSRPLRLSAKEWGEALWAEAQKPGLLDIFNKIEPVHVRAVRAINRGEAARVGDFLTLAVPDGVTALMVPAFEFESRRLEAALDGGEHGPNAAIVGCVVYVNSDWVGTNQLVVVRVGKGPA